MFHKRFLLSLLMLITMFNFMGCKQQDSDTKIKETCMQYLKDKYNEDFEFESVEASWNEGNNWVYSLYAIPKNNPDIKVYVESKPGFKDISDNYKKNKWSKVREEQVKDFVEREFGKYAKYSVGFYIYDEEENKYSLNTDPLDIIKKESTNNNRIDEKLTVYVPIDEDISEGEIIKDVIETKKYYNDINLNSDIRLTFGKKEIDGENNIKDNGDFKSFYAKIDYSTFLSEDKIIEHISYGN